MKKKYRKTKEQRAEELLEITSKLEQGVKDVFSSEKYMEYLRFMGKFHMYSANNCLLIMLQRPDATLVAGYQAWKTQFKRQVREGERGIRILRPCKHKIVTEDEDGEEKIHSFTTFSPTSVFDIAQTDGEDIPSGCVSRLTGSVDGYEELLEKLISISPVPVGFEDIEKNGANGYFNRKEKRIAIRSGMSEQQTVKTLVHEISHAILHDQDSGTAKEAGQRDREVQAESTAYTVCSALGLDTSDYSFGYIAGWSSSKEADELTKSLETIRAAAVQILESLEENKEEEAA